VDKLSSKTPQFPKNEALNTAEGTGQYRAALSSNAATGTPPDLFTPAIDECRY
jgi:hypothetical protein